jgi:Big-like domain-containing protein
VTITNGTGTCTLTASQAGNTHYAPAANVVQSVTAQKAASVAAIIATAPNPSVVAQAVTVSFQVTGTGTPTGSVSAKATTGESCMGNLTAGAGNCSITFASTGTRTLTATYSGDGNFTSKVSATFTQTVNAATTSQLSIAPTNMNFGQVLLGFLGVKIATLTNKSTTPIAISKIAPSHTGTGDFADFDILSLCPKTLAASKSCVVVVSFIPLHDNPTGVVSTSSILVTDNAAGSPQAIAVSAQTINPVAKLSATQLFYATPQKVGTTSASQIITVTNVGSSSLVLGTISHTGADFTIPAAGTTCVAGETLAPTKQCTIAVAFAPKTKGLRIGTVQINDNALISPLLVRLIGQAD